MYVVTLPSSAEKDPLTFVKKAKIAGADIIEIRSDLTPNAPHFHSPLPILVSLRSKDHTLLEVHKPRYIDMEGTEKIELPSDVILIRSYHNFTGTDSLDDLKSLVQELIRAKADIIKIVTTINHYKDNSLLNALDSNIPSSQKRIILGMGVRAHSIRMLSPFNNALTYTYLESGQQAVPGQVPLQLHQLTEHCASPALYGIIGGLAVQSLSPHIQNTLNKNIGFDGIFAELLTDDLDEVWTYIQEQNIQGCAVTSPWKQKIIPLLDRIDSSADQFGAVNTIVKEGDKWTGYMFDTQGILMGYPFLKNLQSATIIGSGGVVGAVIVACHQSGINNIHLYARNMDACADLSKKWPVTISPLSDLHLSTSDILICAINSDIELNLPKANPGDIALDLRYGNSSKFLKKALQQGYTTHNGLPMLVYQAIAQCQIFTKQKPDPSIGQYLLHSLNSYGK